MTYSEQVTLLWFTAISHDFQELLKDTHLLNAHFDEGFAEFIKTILINLFLDIHAHWPIGIKRLNPA